jgi:glucosamine 6-phosphate synthetase-like amidotransferase/phosphosugar isomerase protein
LCIIHNGIIVNEREVWENLETKRELKIDSETIVAIASEHIKNEAYFIDIPKSDIKLRVRDMSTKKYFFKPCIMMRDETELV